jgi:hypothetical protein
LSGCRGWRLSRPCKPLSDRSLSIITPPWSNSTWWLGHRHRMLSAVSGPWCGAPPDRLADGRSPRCGHPTRGPYTDREWYRYTDGSKREAGALSGKATKEDFARFFEEPTREGLREVLKNNVGIVARAQDSCGGARAAPPFYLTLTMHSLSAPPLPRSTLRKTLGNCPFQGINTNLNCRGEFPNPEVGS